MTVPLSSDSLQPEWDSDTKAPELSSPNKRAPESQGGTESRPQAPIQIEIPTVAGTAVKEEKPKAAVKEVSAGGLAKGNDSSSIRNGPRAPNSGNGLDLEKYSWSQSLPEVTVNIPVPPGTTSRFVSCEIKKNRLKVGLKNQPPIIDGELHKSVKVDDSFWSLEDQKFVSILLTKQEQMEWWKCVVKGEPEVDVQKVEPESSSDLDPETRSTVEKMIAPTKIPDVAEAKEEKPEAAVKEVSAKGNDSSSSSNGPQVEHPILDQAIEKAPAQEQQAPEPVQVIEMAPAQEQHAPEPAQVIEVAPAHALPQLLEADPVGSPVGLPELFHIDNRLPVPGLRAPRFRLSGRRVRLARLRDRRVLSLYKVKTCRYHMAGRCRFRHRCFFAHGREERRATPFQSKNLPCPFFNAEGRCYFLGSSMSCPFRH